MSQTEKTTEVPDAPWETIPKMLQSSATSYGDKDAICDGDTTFSYAQLLREAHGAAESFAALGVEKGDRVCIWAQNIHKWIIAALGIHFAGAVLVPLNTRFKGEEAGYILQRSKAKVLCCVTDFLETNYLELLSKAHGQGSAGELFSGLENLKNVVILDGETPKREGIWSWGDFRALSAGSGDFEEEIDKRVEELSSEDLSDILFTSGTTGLPKGVMTTHGQSLKGFKAWSDMVGLNSEDRYLIVNPFFHGFGYKSGWLASLMSGATIYPHAVFDVPEVMDCVEKHRITALPGPPTIYQSILNSPEFGKTDISSLRLAVTGAAAIPVDLIRRIKDDLGFETVVTGYGLTESSAIATMCSHDDDPETIATTSGKAIPGVEVKTVADDGSETAPDEAGEILIRGYNIMQGYLDDPEATAQAINPEGWLHTGDVGVMDERGYLKITDRKKDMFIVGGFNAYPAEVENQISMHPAVAQVAVVGAPDERLGEVGIAFVVKAIDQDMKADELIEWCREKMANYKVPRQVVFTESLPVNASGKVLKYELKKLLAEVEAE